MSDQPYGRNRESLVGLIEQLEEIFKSQPTVKKRPDGQLVLPVAGVREVLKILFEQANMPPFNRQDEESLEAISITNPELELTPSNLLEFVAQLTANMPPEHRFPSVPRKASPTNEAYILGDRGRTHGRNGSGGSRSSSSDSLELNHYDDPDETQLSGRRVIPSGFDARARQRTAPVEAPSSWGTKRPVPASRRRRSDAGSNYGGSDNESSYGYGQSSGRRRPSNPVSPSSSFQQSGMMFRPPSRQGSSGMGRYSRPHSRSHSSLDKGGSHRSESPDAMLVQYSPPRKNSIPIPGMGGDDQEEGDGQEGEDEAHLVPNPRFSLASFTSSNGDTEEQRETLQKALAEVTRRANDTERNLQEQLMAREADIDDIQKQLENTRETISILRKDEKEWRVKERHYVSQINGLEAELNKLQRNLDLARSQHHILSKQHAEQTADLDKYKVTVRAREGEIRELEHRIDTVEHEFDKAGAEHVIAEEQVKRLQAELSKANEVHAELSQQKQENMILKETIDRLRYDLDDLRTAHANDSTKGGSSAPGSTMPSLSRSLGSELLRRLNPTETVDEGEESDATVEDETVEKIEGGDGEEDVFQTIITRKKIVGKGKRVQESVLVDACTQYDEEIFKSGEESDVKPVVKVELASPRSRLLQLPLEDPPSYQLSELEQSGEETMSILRKWHGVKVLGPLPGGISREAVDDWHALKREIGIKCPIIEEIIEQSEKQANGSHTPGFGFSPIKRESARRYVEGGKRRFYNIYNTYILGGEGASSSTSAQRDSAEIVSGTGTISTGKWVIAFGAWSALLLWVGSGGDISRVVPPGGPTYTDRALWSSFNALTGGAGEGFGVVATTPPVDAVGAVWFVVEKLVRGATEIATRRVAFPS